MFRNSCAVPANSNGISYCIFLFFFVLLSSCSCCSSFDGVELLLVMSQSCSCSFVGALFFCFKPPESMRRFRFHHCELFTRLDFSFLRSLFSRFSSISIRLPLHSLAIRPFATCSFQFVSIGFHWFLPVSIGLVNDQFQWNSSVAFQWQRLQFCSFFNRFGVDSLTLIQFIGAV